MISGAARRMGKWKTCRIPKIANNSGGFTEALRIFINGIRVKKLRGSAFAIYEFPI